MTAAFPPSPGPARDALSACVEASVGLGPIERVKAVSDLLAALEARELADETTRRAVLDELRRTLVSALEGIPLQEKDGAVRAATALELLVSLGDAPPREEDDFPGLRERTLALSARLGLDRATRRRLRHRVIFEFYGDMFVAGREPHLLRGLFDLALADEPVVSERARRLCQALLERMMSNLDHFLWFHLLALDRDGARALFARNDGDEVGAALRALLADDQSFARMLADEDLRHGGRTRLTLGTRDHPGLDQLRRLVRTSKPTRWVDLAGGLNTFHRQRAPGMEGAPVVAVDLVRPDPDCLDHLVAMEADWAVHEDPRSGKPWMSARLLTGDELAAFRQRILTEPVEVHTANLLRAGELREAVPPHDGPSLYTLAAYLVSIRPQDEHLRRRAREEGLVGPRISAMQMIENVLGLLRPNDLLSLAGRSVLPYLRGVCWLNAAVTDAGCLQVRGVGYRLGFPGGRLRWELA